MRFTTNRKSFLRLLDPAHSVCVQGEDSALSYLLLRQEKVRVTVQAGDGMVTYQGSMNVEGDLIGEYTIPARPLFAGVKGMPDGEIEILVQDNSLEVIHDQGTLKLRIGIRAEYPTLYIADVADDENPLRVDAIAFHEAWRQVSYAANPQDSRIALGCVALSGEGVCVATDGHRLALREGVPVEGENINYPIPLKMGALLPDDMLGKLQIARQGPYLIIRGPEIYLSQIGAPSSFPDWHPLVDIEGIELHGVASVWLGAVKGASVFAGKLSPLRLRVKKTAQDKLAFYSEGAGSGSMERSVAVENETGWWGKIHLNAAYVRDVLSRLEDVRLIISEAGPIMFQDGEDKHLIMPMRMDD